MSQITDTPAGMRIRRRTVLQAGAAVLLVAAGPLRAQETPPPIVLITGTSSGFGRKMAEGFARRGSRVFATMRDMERRNAPAAKELRTLAAQEKLAIEVLELDVLSDVSIAAAVERAITRAGRIDLLVSNAGIVVPGPVELQPPAYFQSNIETNAFGAMRVIKAVVPHMRQAGQGTIIQMSGALGRAIDPMLGGYCASKLVLEAACDALGYKLAASNIEVAVVQPAGAYPTRFQSNGLRYWEELLASLGPEERPMLDLYAPHIKAMLAGLEPDTSLDPQEVADAVLRLAAMGFGTRPNRLTVGPYIDGIDPVNAAHGQLQTDMIGHSPAASLFTLK
ncbi:short-chain dehydrogenase protein (plasmid) [Rhizobium etli 8C-3]|uniref:Short-chain dehydrogenase protein n=2 Tax=Rhizobium TaxID=379 RepID=A0A1L5PIC1_RHIET|nr:SDR family oxidoreductase [Rhizobium etli]APO79815.1 short-chain dehydrogenase protein [Rhizobium etli 8C-3]